MAEGPIHPQPCPNSCPSCGRGGKNVGENHSAVSFHCRPCDITFTRIWPPVDDFDTLYVDIGGES